MEANSNTASASRAVSMFQFAARRVPAYMQLLGEAGVSPCNVRSVEDFRKFAPILDKRSTFGRFCLAQLCRDGRLGNLASVLTSSGHSGKFSFGLYEEDSLAQEAQRTDAALDAIFQVKSKPTLLINCLPMGVRIATRSCTVAETSVRADMVTALVAALHASYEQIIIIGDISHVKHVLELGAAQGIDWGEILVHLVVGEDLLAENARHYFQHLLEIDPDDPQTGFVGTSMGVAEVGMNLFYETAPLVSLRRRLHENSDLRNALLGPSFSFVPLLFVYDPQRLFVESDPAGRLLITTLDPSRRIPLIRYATGDMGRLIRDLPSCSRWAAELGMPPAALAQASVLLMQGRGECALAGEERIYPEQVKEGLYHDPALAGQTTANFRLRSGQERATLRIQLSPGVAPSAALTESFAQAVALYVPAPLTVRCEPFESFGSGMALDYERKLDYLGD